MVSSVSSKYLNYNPHKNETEVSSINGGEEKFRIGNFNEYQHVYNDHKSNEANVQWITKLRENDNRS